MKTKVRKIGNSFGIIITKKLLEQADIQTDVFLSIEDEKITIEPIKENPRKDWENQFKKAGAAEDFEMLIDDFQNDFDKEEWTW